MNNLTPYENDQLRGIVTWEKEEPSVISKVGGQVFKPFTWVLSKIIPDKVMEGVLATCNTTGAFLADKGDILRDGKVDSINELRFKDLEMSDRLANNVHNWAIGFATAEGAAGGALGVPGMIADIPALITLAYRTMHKIALCYGFECTSPEEKMFLNHIIAAANANTVQEKALSVVALQQIYVMIAKTTWRKMAEKAATDKFSKEAFVMAIKTLTKSLGPNLTKRKALQAIPIVGGAVGASMNAAFINDVAWAARRNFQKRWLLINEKIIIPKEN